MGFFSWNCIGCGHPMLNPYSVNGINSWMANVVVIEGGSKTLLRGEYDGYGRVDDRDIQLGPWKDNSNLENEPCCYHDACWVKAGEPTEYIPSTHAEDQGYFFDDEHDIEPPT